MGMFDQDDSDGLWTWYRGYVEFREKLMGGTPKSPKMIEGWLRKKAGLTDDEEELRRAMLRTLLELGAEVRPDMTFEEMEAASEGLAALQQTNGFKRDAEHGLYVEGRVLKSAIKETVNILYAGTRWGKTAKGPKAFVAERAFPVEDRVYLGTDEPTAIDLFIGHTSGPRGPQSNLTYFEYVYQPSIEFHFQIAKAEDVIRFDEWKAIWKHAQDNGIGALRSQGFGRFDIWEWEPVPRPEAAKRGPRKQLPGFERSDWDEEQARYGRLVGVTATTHAEEPTLVTAGA